MKKWIQSLKDTLHDLGLYYDASYAGDAPDMDKSNGRTSPATKPAKLPDNISWTNADPYLYTDNKDGRSWDLFDGSIPIGKDLTKEDYQVIRERQLDEVRYRRVKFIVSQLKPKDRTNEVVARKAKNEYGKGYGKRNVDDCMAALREACALSVGGVSA